MSCIYKGELIISDLVKNAKGGTELMRDRIIENIDKDLLSNVAIHFSRAHKIYEDVPNLLYLHDLPQDPEIDKLEDNGFIDKIDKFIFVSHHQKFSYNILRNLPYSKSVVIPNGISSPSIDEINNNFNKVYNEDDPIKLIYHTTPHRGLNILIPVFNELRKHFNIELDIFSSFKMYGWNEKDKEFEDIFKLIDESEGIKNHGYQPNSTIISHLKQSDIFAYPCIWPETSCISLIEALSYGNICVHPDYWVLPETSKGLSQMYDYHEDLNKHGNIFYVEMYKAIMSFQKLRKDNSISQVRKNIALFARSQFDFNQIKTKWNNLLSEYR